MENLRAQLKVRTEELEKEEAARKALEEENTQVREAAVCSLATCHTYARKYVCTQKHNRVHIHTISTPTRVHTDTRTCVYAHT